MSALQPLEPVQLGDRTFRSIRRAIVTGELAAGEPLRDRTLAETLGVSRTPVREALSRLGYVGLVEPRGRSGWVVAPFSEQDIHELFELRRALEPLGLDQLERRPDPEAVAELARFFDGYEHPIPRECYGAYFEADHGFHERIVQCSGNERLSSFYQVIGSHIDRGRHFLSTGRVGRVEANLDEHRAIARALGEGDIPRARTELLHHLDLGEDLMIDQLRRVGPSA